MNVRPATRPLRSVLVREHHGSCCDCAAHRPREEAAAASTSAWSALLPVLACAVCPVCLSTYAKILSMFGLGFGLTETHHAVLLTVALGTSVAVSAWRSVRTRRIWPLAVAASGAVLVIAGHMADVHALEWGGVLVLLVGGLTEHFRLRRLSAAVAPAAAVVDARA